MRNVAREFGDRARPTPRGPQQKLLRLRVDAAGNVTHDKPFTVPLKEGWRSQSGVFQA
jgi:hypothetical protein